MFSSAIDINYWDYIPTTDHNHLMYIAMDYVLTVAPSSPNLSTLSGFSTDVATNYNNENLSKPSMKRILDKVHHYVCCHSSCSGRNSTTRA